MNSDNERCEDERKVIKDDLLDIAKTKLYSPRHTPGL